MQAYFIITMFIFGAALGSFLCCQARRLHLRNIIKPKTSCKKTAKKPLLKKPASLPARSICLNCKTQLHWFENIPLLSWLLLRGRCRHCKAKIGIAEFLSELFGGIIFAAIASMLKITTTGFVFALPNSVAVESPFALPLFITMLLLILSLSFLAIYDALYQELPSFCLTFAGICAAVLAALKIWSLVSAGSFAWSQILNLLGAIFILAGIYLVLYLISKGKWVGDGDWILCLILALALGDSFLALCVLCFSNILGCVVMLPILKTAQKSKKSQKSLVSAKIPFGPFLVAGFLLALFLSPALLSLI